MKNILAVIFLVTFFAGNVSAQDLTTATNDSGNYTIESQDKAIAAPTPAPSPSPTPTPGLKRSGGGNIADYTPAIPEPITDSPVQTTPNKKRKCQFTSVGIDVLPFSPRDSNEFSPDYGWKCGNYFAGGGFAEKGLNRNLISRHNIRFKPFPKQLPWLAIRQEFAFNKSGYALQTGLQFELTQFPVIKKPLGKVFRSLSISPMARWAGNVGTFNETQVAWNTKLFKVWELAFWSEGFERIRGGNRKDFGQWQVWGTSPKLSEKIANFFRYDKSIQIAAGFEIENRGWFTKHTPMFGFKVFKIFK